MTDEEFRQLQLDYERACSTAAQLRAKLLAVKVTRFEESIK